MTTLYALLPSDPLSPRVAEPAFAQEADVASTLGFRIALLDHDELDQRIDPAAALRRASFEAPGVAVYRGWMLTSKAYGALYAELVRRGIELITSPQQYAACHHAPGSYDALAEFSPEAAFVPMEEFFDLTDLPERLKRFDGAPLVLKDWVKSQAAGYWKEACLIPDSSSHHDIRRVVSRFLELQGASLVGGLAFKRFLPLVAHDGTALEYRVFAVDGSVVGQWPRSLDAEKLAEPPPELTAAVAARVPSPFASLDFGRDLDGRWWLLEAGDGQVSALPTQDSASDLFKALRKLALR